jgi:hypothetical protein
MRSGAVPARLALAAASIAAVLAFAAPAHAVYECGGQKDDCKCGADDPYPCCSNGGNCTWWAWEAACCNWAKALPGWGNANQWAGNAKAHPDYDVQSTPVVGSIACRQGGTYGHVAWVTKVNGSSIEVTEENCCGSCNYGMRTWTYQASYFDGGFIVRVNQQCDCSAGQTQTQDCGKCGKQTRGCAASCKWDAWGACGGEGECSKGQTEDKACGDCGKQTRTCSDACSWSAFGACAGPDPNGGKDACETGLKGVCAAGVKRCVAGSVKCEQTTKSSTEVCDGKDNDCDGQIDEVSGCAPVAQDAGDAAMGKDGGWPTPSGDSGARTDGAAKTDGAVAGDGGLESVFAANSQDDAGCGCTSARARHAAGWLAAAVGLALALGSRRARRRRG